MKDYRIGYVVLGHSEYDNDVSALLSKKHPYQRCFSEFNHLDLADCFVLAGADIRSTTVDNDVRIEIFIEADEEAEFLKRLDVLITEKYLSLKVKRDW